MVADGSDGMTQRTIYVAHTNTGLEGLGEYSGPPADQETLDHYIGTSPFAHLNDEVHLGIFTPRSSEFQQEKAEVTVFPSIFNVKLRAVSLGRGLGTAMYDLMGKASGLPCHKLFGQQVALFELYFASILDPFTRPSASR